MFISEWIAILLLLLVVGYFERSGCERVSVKHKCAIIIATLISWLKIFFDT